MVHYVITNYVRNMGHPPHISCFLTSHHCHPSVVGLFWILLGSLDTHYFGGLV